eukprot:gene11608-13712_t
MTSKEEYLKRYLSGASAEATVKKKKKKKTEPLQGAPAVKKLISQGPLIVDHDLGFGKPDEPEPIIDEPEEDAPILVESEGQRRLREREERLKNSEYFGIKEDGSGWVELGRLQLVKTSLHRGGLVPTLATYRRLGEEPVKMSDGSITGLIQGKDLSQEMDRKRKMEAAKEGFLVEESKTESLLPYVARQAAKEKREAEKIRPEWGAGMKQRQAADDFNRELAEEASKPFARTRDDKDLDAMFKTKTRWGDPMAHLVKDKGPILSDLDQLQGSTGFKIPTQ